MIHNLSFTPSVSSFIPSENKTPLNYIGKYHYRIKITGDLTTSDFILFSIIFFEHTNQPDIVTYVLCVFSPSKTISPAPFTEFCFLLESHLLIED